jgi:polysaccharide export outer membrane protein
MTQGLLRVSVQWPVHRNRGGKRSSRSLPTAAMLGGLGIFALTAWAGELVPYVLGPDDEITIRAMDADEISDKPFAIDSSGLLNLPMLGRVQAAGLTVVQLEAELMTRLKEFVWDARVAVTVTQYLSKPVSVIGAVNTPGVQQLRTRKTLVDVLSVAGGLRPDAGSKVAIQRQFERGPIPLPNAKADPTGRFSLADVSVRSIMENAHPEANILIQPNDVISVPRADMVYVIGEVKKAGGFPLNDREALSVLQVVSLAEGLQPTAAPTAAQILRSRASTGGREEIAVDLKRILSGKTPDVLLRPDDILFVPGSTGKKAAVRGIEAVIQLGTGILIWRH